MAKATKLPSGNWRVSCYVGRDASGKQIRKSITAPTRKEAELLAAQFAVKQKHNSIPGNKTVAMAFDEYINGISNLLSPATLVQYHSVARNLPPYFANLPMNKITNAVVQTYVNDLAGNLSPDTVRCYYAKVCVVLKHNKIELPEVILPRSKKPEMQIPTSEEIDRIISGVTGTHWEIPVLLAAHMGLRRGEVSALTWGDVDMTAGILHVRHSLVQGTDGVYDRRPKTNASYRDLVMPSTVKDVLAAVPPGLASERICQIPFNHFSYFANTAKKHCGTPFSFHTLRHYYASVLLSLGVPNKYAMKRTGHSSDGTLQRVYQHIMEDRDAQVDVDIDRYFGGR